LAKRGMNILMISKYRENLHRTEQELRREYGVDVKSVAVDFTNTEVYETIRHELQGLDVGVLINNVGTGTGSAFQTFLQINNL